MCTVPPAPPPLPPPLHINVVNSMKSAQDTPYLDHSDVCQWAKDQPELLGACALYKICLENPPFIYKYTHFESIPQVGPTCGLAALSMLVNGEVTAEEMLNISKLEGFSNNGEMFSCKSMAKLSKKVISLAEIEDVRIELKTGGLFSKETIDRLLNGAVMLIPYDADFNHSPCLKRGHTAHWAIVCGIIVINDPGEAEDPDPNNIYVLTKHGKSKFLAAWNLKLLHDSNNNLWEFSPKRGAENLVYILPEGGVGGENGLRDQFLIFEGL